MKIATVLSVSALLATFSVVACSSPTTPVGGDSDKSDSADSKSDAKDSKSSTSSKSNTSSPASTASNTQTTTNGTTTTASEAACTSCLAADPTMKKVMDCTAKCADTDDACFVKCGTDNGCAENDPNSACAKQSKTCADKCQGADGANGTTDGAPTQAEQQACNTCLTAKNNAQVNAIEKCFAASKDQAGDDKCDQLAQSTCDQACDAAYKACADKCPFLGQ